MDCIRDYEPNLVRYIMDFVFIPCREDKEGKHKYISAIPEKGSSSIIRNERGNFRNLEILIIDKSANLIGSQVFSYCANLN